MCTVVIKVNFGPGNTFQFTTEESLSSLPGVYMGPRTES